MNQYLTFYVAGEEYAVTILKVTEIIECVSLTHVPGTPAWYSSDESDENPSSPISSS